MAIAIDTSAYIGSGGSYTCTGTNLILFVGVTGAIGSDDVTAITYNGVSLTKIGGLVTPSSNGRGICLWYLINPATGANTIAITGGGFIDGYAASYTGAKQSAQPDASTTNGNVSASDLTTSVTTIAANDWLVEYASGNDGNAISATSGVSSRNVGGTGFGLYDSNGTVATGSVSAVMHRAALNGMAVVLAAFSPALAAGPANLKSYNTNLKSNINSVNTNLIANVKSLDTNV